MAQRTPTLSLDAIDLLCEQLTRAARPQSVTLAQMNDLDQRFAAAIRGAHAAISPDASLANLAQRWPAE
jgi:streptomycin 6-kinase